MFSDDNAKRFMVENFGQYLSEDSAAGSSSLGTLQQVLSQPTLLLQQLVDPPGQTLLYLLGQGLPFLFIPLISLDTALLAGPSLLGLVLGPRGQRPLVDHDPLHPACGARVRTGSPVLVGTSAKSKPRVQGSSGLGLCFDPLASTDD